MAVMLLIASCKKDKPVNVDLGYDYFPNRVNHYVIYNVDSIVVNQLSPNIIDTFSYQIKEVIDSIYPDNTGRPTQRIVRYKRATDTSKWVIEKVWSGNLTTTTAERVEDNNRYTRLIFPPKVNATWNGNAANILGEMDYQYSNVDVAFSQGANFFDSTLTVIEDSNLNFVQHQFYFERYARNVGRIYRDVIDLQADSIIITDNGIPFPLGHPNLVPTQTLLKKLHSGSVIYSETYVSSGN